MKNQLRVTLLSALCAAGAMTAGARPGHAQNAAKAEEHNNAGKALFKERRYLEAYRQFKQAVALSPEGRFYFNVCFSLNYLERFQEAIEACEKVEGAGADDKLMQKTNAVLDALRAKVPPPSNPNTGNPNTGNPNTGDPNAGDPNAGNPNTGDPNAGNPNTGDPNAGNPNTGDPNAGNPNTGNPNAGNPNTGVPNPQNPNPGGGPARVPGLDPFAPPKPTGDYAWSLGATAGPLLNLGVGQNERGDFYEGGGLGINLFANFMYKPEQKLGLQGYVSIGNLPPVEEVLAQPLRIVDLGGAVYKHFPINDKISLSPLLGLHLSIMQPDPDFEEALVAVGARAQLSVDYHLGARKEHVISFAPTLNVYGAAADSSVLLAENFGLDEGGSTFEIAFGYQYRFTTPFGSSPLFTLE